MKLSERMSRLGTEDRLRGAGAARALEAQGKSVVHLEIGEPDFDTPAHVSQAAMAALQAGATHYGPSAGLPELRAAIADDSSRRRGVKATPEMVVVTPGGKPIMFFVILALVDPGDEVLYPNPGFPIYESMIRFIGGVPVPVRLLEEKQFALDVDQLLSRVSRKTRLIILNSPHNPTGGIIPEDGLRAIADAAVKHGIPVLSDEIYCRILYDAEHKSIAALPGMQPLAIVLDGFSKTYAMTGWRLGYGVMPAPFAQQLAKLQTNSTSCTATFTQLAGVAALAGDQGSVDAMVAEFKRPPRRDRGRPARDPGHPVRAAEGRLLRVPQHLRDGLLCARARRPSAGRGRCRLPRRHRVRRVRRGAPALLLREQPGEHRGGARPHPRALDMSYRIFATCDIGQEALDRLRQKGYALEVYDKLEPPPKALILEKVKGRRRRPDHDAARRDRRRGAGGRRGVGAEGSWRRTRSASTTSTAPRPTSTRSRSATPRTC
jgi:aspartate/methionine/tyrosine aminotransferase